MPRRSMVIAALSTMVEWYDFTLYLYFATVLARVFFAADGHSMTQTLGGFAIAYLLRPIGAWCSATLATASGGALRCWARWH